MTVLYKTVDFKTLRAAFLEVKKFVENETFGKVISMNTRLVEDLGCTGDDNVDLLEKFIKQYNLDLTGFDYEKHFHTEYELYLSFSAAVVFSIKLPVYILFRLIRLITLGRIKADEVVVKMTLVNRSVTDMTIGDMVTWYLEGKYKLRKDLKYK